MYILYKTLWNFTSSISRHDYGDYIGKIRGVFENAYTQKLGDIIYSLKYTSQRLSKYVFEQSITHYINKP